jgi:hypothetical protein
MRLGELWIVIEGHGPLDIDMRRVRRERYLERSLRAIPERSAPIRG